MTTTPRPDFHRRLQAGIQTVQSALDANPTWRDPVSLKIRAVFNTFLSETLPRTEDGGREKGALQRAWDELHPLLCDAKTAIPLEDSPLLGSDGRLYDPKAIIVWIVSLPSAEAKGPRKSPVDVSHTPFTVKPHPIVQSAIEWLSAFYKNIDPKRAVLESIYQGVQSGHPSLPSLPTEEAEKKRLKAEALRAKISAPKGASPAANLGTVLDDQKKLDDKLRQKFAEADRARARQERTHAARLQATLQDQEEEWELGKKTFNKLQERAEAVAGEIMTLGQSRDLLTQEIQATMAETMRLKRLQDETAAMMQSVSRESSKGVFRTVCHIAICSFASWVTSVPIGPMPGGAGAPLYRTTF